MMCALTHSYGYTFTSKEKTIEDFFAKYHHYAEWDIDTILSFDTNSKVVNGTKWEIEFDNGEELIKNMINDFKNILKN